MIEGNAGVYANPQAREVSVRKNVRRTIKDGSSRDQVFFVSRESRHVRSMARLIPTREVRCTFLRNPSVSGFLSNTPNQGSLHDSILSE